MSTVLTVLEIVLGLGMVIFVHELGHFLVAKWCNVRVEAFSLGFGPKMFGFRRGETDYKVCWLPLGGYVKMSGEVPGEGDPKDPRHFTNKAVWQRAAIFSAGVVMNLLFGLLVFIVAFRIGVKFQEPRVGTVVPGEPAWQAGVQKGDLIKAIDGKEVASFQDIIMLVAFADADHGLTFTVERDGKDMEFRVYPHYNEAAGVQSIGLDSESSREIAVLAGSAASAAGLEDGDVLVAIEGRPVESMADFNEIFFHEPALDSYEIGIERNGEPMSIRLEPQYVSVPKIGIVNGSVTVKEVAPGSVAAARGVRPGDRLLRVDEDGAPSFDGLRRAFRKDRREGRDEPRKVVFRRDGQEVVHELRPEEGLRFLDGVYEEHGGVSVGMTLEGFPADEVLLPGDVITEVDGKAVEQWSEFVERVKEKGTSSMKISFLRDGEAKTAEISPRETRQWEADPGFGLRPTVTDPIKHDFASSVRLGWRHSIDNFKYVLMTLHGIFTAKVSARHLGGPVAIGQMAYQFSQLGFGRFIYFLGLLSINLAIINLLPIPILDGFHLLLLGLEKVKGRPLSENAQIKLNWVGLFVIIALMLFVFTNDILRLIRTYT